MIAHDPALPTTAVAHTSRRRRRGSVGPGGTFVRRRAGYLGRVTDSSATDHDPSLAGARAAAARGTTQAWIRSFLASPGSDNAVLAEQLASEKPVWFGPVRLRFDELNRLAGPPDQPTLGRLDEDDLETVADMEESLDDGWEPPPLIVTTNDGELVVEDGNHRIEGLRQSGESAYWSLIGFDDDAQRDAFLAARHLVADPV